MKALWQAWQDLNNFLDNPETVDAIRKVGRVLKATGEWLIEKSGPQTMGSSPDDEIDESETIRELTRFIDSQGGVVPMAAGDGVGARGDLLKELLEIAIPLLLKFLVK